jgi:hypothetical protein
MTDKRSGVHLGHLDLGSGFALVQRSGWKAAVFKRGVRFSGGSVMSKREHVKRAGRDSVKQRPNPPDSAARTDVLGHIV